MKPGKIIGDRLYRILWKAVDGAVKDVLHSHPDYFTDKGLRNFRTSVTKRAVGQIGSSLQASDYFKLKVTP